MRTATRRKGAGRAGLRRRLAFTLVGMSLTACSGATTANGGEEGTGSAEPFNPIRYTLIDDMERSSGEIAWPPPAGTTPGTWDTYADVQCSDVRPISTWDTADMGAWSYATVPEPHETFRGIFSRQAARVQTLNPLANTWGAGMGFNFAFRSSDQNVDGIPDNRPCTGGLVHDAWVPIVAVDLSAYRGITFWAMAARRGTTTMHLEFFDRNTTPEGEVCLAAGRDLSSCYNGFGVYLDLTDTFARYTVDFASVTQSPDWGYHPIPNVLDLTHVYAMNFQVETPSTGTCNPAGPIICAAPSWVPTVSFDFWIDDIYFVQK